MKSSALAATMDASSETLRDRDVRAQGFESIRVIVEPPTARLMASAPVHVRPEAQLKWLHAALAASRDSAALRTEVLERVRQENDRLKAEFLALKAQVATFAEQNALLRESLVNAEDRMERAELLNAIRQAPAARPWWRFW